MSDKKYSKYEKARIVGARALQISMGAPIIIEIPKEVVDPLRIALLEFENGAIPMTVKRKKKAK
ncbi:MAG: DNA-directed RNA polymerase subunit K [Candidatus Thermoplasmatota archaeon]|nr:DNA-directed RNA polymerase subunit K [Candidatus Thermoplasmatota archaeon]MCL5789136.1 DNA-directed RNA polymerase subunit K [Candidatus Thermoplasmatota archaeon]